MEIHRHEADPQPISYGIPARHQEIRPNNRLMPDLICGFFHSRMIPQAYFTAFIRECSCCKASWQSPDCRCPERRCPVGIYFLRCTETVSLTVNTGQHNGSPPVVQTYCVLRGECTFTIIEIDHCNCLSCDASCSHHMKSNALFRK